MKNGKLKKLSLAAMFLAVGLVLPFLTGQIPVFGKMLLPMHLPVMLCGLICGPFYGLFIGAALPLLRCFLFGAPVFFPDAAVMVFELAAYGFTLGFFFSKAKWKCLLSLYRCLVFSMLSGRIVWALVKSIFLGVGKDGFTLKIFFMSGFVNALPGIILQLVLIPSIMLLLDKTHLVPFSKNEKNSVKDE